nr:MAG TPA: hypothetical protein [Bacteriophage sp.]
MRSVKIQFLKFLMLLILRELYLILFNGYIKKTLKIKE